MKILFKIFILVSIVLIPVGYLLKRKENKYFYDGGAL